MSPDEKAGSFLEELKEEILRDLEVVARVEAQVTDEHRRTGSTTPSGSQLAFFALQLDRAYSACEAIMNRIARALDHHTPIGQSWHASLLNQMTLPIQDVRPSVLRVETATRLEELLRFRHFLRHAYRTELDWARLRPLVDALPQTARALRADLSAFVQTLVGPGQP